MARVYVVKMILQIGHEARDVDAVFMTETKARAAHEGLVKEMGNVFANVPPRQSLRLFEHERGVVAYCAGDLRAALYMEISQMGGGLMQ